MRACVCRSSSRNVPRDLIGDGVIAVSARRAASMSRCGKTEKKYSASDVIRSLFTFELYICSFFFALLGLCLCVHDDDDKVAHSLGVPASAGESVAFESFASAVTTPGENVGVSRRDGTVLVHRWNKEAAKQRERKLIIAVVDVDGGVTAKSTEFTPFELEQLGNAAW